MAPSPLGKVCLTRQSYLAGGPGEFRGPGQWPKWQLSAGPKRYLGGAYDSYRRRLSR